MSLAFLAIYLLSLAFAPPRSAQTAAADGLISGRVVDATSHVPIAGAQVILSRQMVNRWPT
jgi:hypothetical protein